MPPTRTRRPLPPGLSPEVLAQLRALRDLPDDQIDTTDIPEVLDWSRAVRGAFHHSSKGKAVKNWTSDDKRRATADELAKLAKLAGANNYWFAVPIGDGKFAAIARTSLTHDILTGPISGVAATSPRWSYSNAVDALKALEEWQLRDFDGEPLFDGKPRP